MLNGDSRIDARLGLITGTIQLIQEARALRAEAARLRAQLHAATLEARQYREAGQRAGAGDRGVLPVRLFRDHNKRPAANCLLS